MAEQGGVENRGWLRIPHTNHDFNSFNYAHQIYLGGRADWQGRAAQQGISSQQMRMLLISSMHAKC